MTSVFNKKSQTPRRKLLRRNLSKAEILLWLQLKNKKINGHKFRRQYSVGRYVVDFYCPALKLAIEIDGGYHLADDAREYDKIRQKVIESYGIRFLRFSDTEVIKNMPGVIKSIQEFSKSSPPLEGGGWGR